MNFTKSRRIPGFRISTITATTICLFEQNFVALMITILIAIHTNYAATINAAIKALNNSISLFNYFCTNCIPLFLFIFLRYELWIKIFDNAFELFDLLYVNYMDELLIKSNCLRGMKRYIFHIFFSFKLKP